MFDGGIIMFGEEINLFCGGINMFDGEIKMFEKGT